MKKAFEMMEAALAEACQHKCQVEAIDVCACYDADGKLSDKAESAPIQVRLVAYPRHLKNDTA